MSVKAQASPVGIAEDGASGQRTAGGVGAFGAVAIGPVAGGVIATAAEVSAGPGGVALTPEEGGAGLDVIIAAPAVATAAIEPVSRAMVAGKPSRISALYATPADPARDPSSAAPAILDAMIRRLLVVTVTAAGLGPLAAIAGASRAPNAVEKREILRDAKRSLSGAGWQVSAIRVSTVDSHYAEAAVSQRATGPAGEMILRLRHGIWHRVFLGTDEFCSAHVPKRVLDDLGFGC